MANAKRCDTCGKFYMHEDKEFTVNGYKVAEVILAANSGGYIERYDVCDECAEKIYNLLEGGCLEGKE